MNLQNNKKYQNDLKEYANIHLEWKKLNKKTIMISGATGLVGRYLIDLIMYKNIIQGFKIRLIAIGRNKKKMQSLFKEYRENEFFEILEQDVKEKINFTEKIDYMIHLASNTYPNQYVTDPIGTIMTNVWGTYNLLDYGTHNGLKKFIFISSFEVYGKLTTKKKIEEHDFGKIDTTILRSCYPESKRVSESMCIAFSEQLKIPTTIIRLSRVFGPTMNMNSTLSINELIKNGLNNEDIILKSKGNQLYSFNYVGDAVTAILFGLIYGKDKEAYNVSDEKFNIQLKEFAKIIAKKTKTNVKFELPTEIEQKGFSNSTMTILNSEKLNNLGWKVINKNIKYRIEETLDILKNK